MEKKSESSIAKDFIEEHKETMKRKEMLKHIYNTTTLGYSTINNLLTDALKKPEPIIVEKKVKKKFQEPNMLYKGKPRDFFYFDISNLYINS